MQRTRGPLIAIVGGVGPHASVLFERILLDQVKSNGSDQSFPPTLHLSMPELISDRTDYLLQDASAPTIANPGVAVGELVKVAKRMASLVASGGAMECIVPCNTFHSPEIFNACVKASGGIRPLHLVEITVEAIRRNHPQALKVGLMSTTGTRNFRLYHDLLEAEGLEVVEVDLDTQEELHRTIYDSERGIKAVGKTMWSVNRFASYAQQIVDTGGADVLIMGCTEIPIVLESCGVPLVDPMVCGAQELVRRTYPDKLISEGNQD
eukprot:g4222.t1